MWGKRVIRRTEGMEPLIEKKTGAIYHEDIRTFEK